MTDADRYERLRSISWWDPARVRGARAIVAGAGALGNEVVKNLLMLGWGSIVLVDHDVVELGNLTRSALLRPEDVGRPKVEVIAERGREFNADCVIVPVLGDLRATLSAGMVERSDVVFGCVDNISARVALGQLAGLSGALFVDGGLTTWEGTVQVFSSRTEDEPCYACGLTEEDIRELTLRYSCLAYQENALAAGGLPTTPTVTSVISAVMVQEGLKWIHRGAHDMPLFVGSELRFDLAYARSWVNRLPLNEECLVHWQRALPVRDPEFGWTVGWDELVRRIADRLGVRSLTLRLPSRVLLGWNCLNCGANADVFEVYAGDGRIPCSRCAEDVVPRFVSEVSGEEPWAALTPQGMGFGPWTWLTTLAGDATVVVELDGADEPLADLWKRG
ncbi:ThiF family adenylyltransferase [Longispora sp. K20-0274]|uniref:ThiF family adenylyltransferase n=1 Tax=Longispora sp. K20-0274 TaxID=3088255 RepID=UPI00399987A3